MKRAAIYARYSSENQRDASIEDQIEVCRRYAARQGFRSRRPSRIGRSPAPAATGPAIRTLLRRCRRGAFDVVIVEALDRLGAQARRMSPACTTSCSSTA